MLARKDRELHDLERDKQDKMDLEFQNSRLKIQTLERELIELKSNHEKEMGEGRRSRGGSHADGSDAESVPLGSRE